MAMDSAIDLLGGALRIAWRVFEFLCDLFVEVILAKLGNTTIRLRDRQAEPSAEASIFVGAVVLAFLALAFGLVYMLI